MRPGRLKAKRMKSIKEKAAEYRKVIKVINKHESIVDTQGSEMFEAGANYVLETIEKECKRIAQLCKSHIENPVDEEDRVDSWARLDEMEYMLKFIERLKEK